MSLFASFDGNTIVNFGNVSQFRGCLGYSITELDLNLNLISTKWFDKNWDPRNVPKGQNYKICFMKHPTALSDSNEEYPLMQDDQFLWYDGFISKSVVKRIGPATTFIDVLNTKTHLGIYSYIWIKNGELFCGKDSRSSLFIDKHFSLSTFKFYGSDVIQPFICWNLDFEKKALKFSWESVA